MTRAFCRSGFLRAAAATAALPTLVRALQSEAPAATAPILVVIAQVGGCDMLNTVIPLRQYGRYVDLRKPQTSPYDPILGLNISLAKLSATAFDRNPRTAPASASEFAFHPRMHALRRLYGAGHVAVLSGVGIPPDEPNRLSHETGRFDWQTASIKRLGFSSEGWLGLAYDGTPSMNLPPLVSLSGDLPTLMRGRRTNALGLSAPLESFTGDIPAESDEEKDVRRALFVRLQEAATGNGQAESIRQLSKMVSVNIAKVEALAKRAPAEEYPKAESGLGQQLAQIGRLIVAGAGSRAYFATQDGYDTHVEQQRSHPDLVGDFSDQVANFYRYLRAKGAASNVVVMSYTDFGRRPRADQNFGTDHGTAAVNFLIGDRVRGGVYGDYPSLMRLDDEKNMSIGIDFRNQIAEVATHLGLDAKAIAGRAYPSLGCFA